MAEDGISFNEETEDYVSINVQIKVAGIDLDELKSSEKVFRFGGKEYPSSRLGTWVLQGHEETTEKTDILNDGGVGMALIWSLYQNYPDINIWANGIRDLRFTFDVKKSEQQRILGDTASGIMARSVEKSLKELDSPKTYQNLRIKLIKIITETTSDSPPVEEEPNSHIWDKARIDRLAEAERIANLMGSGQITWAMTLMKQGLAKEKNQEARLQMSLRHYICAIMVNNSKEQEDCLARVLDLIGKAKMPPDQITFYLKDINILFELLKKNESFMYAIELMLAFTEVVKTITDVNERLDKLSSHLNQISSSMKELLMKNPGVALKCQMLENIKKMEKEIDYMRSLTESDSLVYSQSIYYCSFQLAEVKVRLDKQVQTIFREPSIEFQRLSTCWADLPFVVTRLRMHPDVSKYFQDEKFRDDIKLICKNPAILEQKLKDPKIAKANEVLMSDFGLFAKESDVQETLKQLESSNGDAKKETKPVDKKQEAQNEKEKGNEAYKEQRFEEAHTHYNKAIELDPTDALLHNNKAAVYISEENYELARAACLHAVNMAQKSNRHDGKDVAKITARLARVEYLDKHPEIALALYKKSLEINFDSKVEEQMKQCEETILSVRLNAVRLPF